MPHEKINHIRNSGDEPCVHCGAPVAFGAEHWKQWDDPQAGFTCPNELPGGTPMRERGRDQFIVGWNTAPEPWCQVSIALDGWRTTGDWHIVNLNKDDVDRAIKALKRARKMMSEVRPQP